MYKTHILHVFCKNDFYTDEVFLTKESNRKNKIYNVDYNFLSEEFPWSDDNLYKANKDKHKGKKCVCGSLEIVDYGCAIFPRLVVSGKERNKIWMQDSYYGM